MIDLIEALKPTIRSVNFNSLPQSSNYVGSIGFYWSTAAALHGCGIGALLTGLMFVYIMIA